MRIYVAAASKEIDRARAFMDRLRALGHEITSDWPEVIAKVGDANPTDATRAQRRGWAQADLDQVAGSDLLVVLLPTPHITTEGMWVELGYGLGHNEAVGYGFGHNEAYADPSVLLVGEHRSIFAALGDFAPDEDAAIHWIEKRPRPGL